MYGVSKYAHGPRFTDEQRQFIISSYESMKTLPVILTDFRHAYPDRGASVTENSLRTLIDRARKAKLIKRNKYSRQVAMDVKMHCIELYNGGATQQQIISGLKKKFRKFGRDITRNMISGWVKWGKDHKLLTRKVERPASPSRVTRRVKVAKESTIHEIFRPVTLPYVRCLDPLRAQHMASLLRQPVEVVTARLSGNYHRSTWGD